MSNNTGQNRAANGRFAPPATQGENDTPTIAGDTAPTQVSDTNDSHQSPQDDIAKASSTTDNSSQQPVNGTNEPVNGTTAPAHTEHTNGTTTQHDLTLALSRLIAQENGSVTTPTTTTQATTPILDYRGNPLPIPAHHDLLHAIALLTALGRRVTDSQASNGDSGGMEGVLRGGSDTATTHGDQVDVEMPDANAETTNGAVAPRLTPASTNYKHICTRRAAWPAEIYDVLSAEEARLCEEGRWAFWWGEHYLDEGRVRAEGERVPVPGSERARWRLDRAVTADVQEG